MTRMATGLSGSKEAFVKHGQKKLPGSPSTNKGAPGNGIKGLAQNSSAQR